MMSAVYRRRAADVGAAEAADVDTVISVNRWQHQQQQQRQHPVIHGLFLPSALSPACATVLVVASGLSIQFGQICERSLEEFLNDHYCQ